MPTVTGFTFSANSLRHLKSCHPDLQIVLQAAIKVYDFSVVFGHRGQQAQDLAFQTGMSKLKWPNSKHNSLPSKAFDIYPYHATYGSLT
jgi:hypothetical protein